MDIELSLPTGLEYIPGQKEGLQVSLRDAKQMIENILENDQPHIYDEDEIQFSAYFDKIKDRVKNVVNVLKSANHVVKREIETNITLENAKQKDGGIYVPPKETQTLVQALCSTTDKELITGEINFGVITDIIHQLKKSGVMSLPMRNVSEPMQVKLEWQFDVLMLFIELYKELIIGELKKASPQNLINLSYIKLTCQEFKHDKRIEQMEQEKIGKDAEMVAQIESNIKAARETFQKNKEQKAAQINELKQRQKTRMLKKNQTSLQKLTQIHQKLFIPYQDGDLDSYEQMRKQFKVQTGQTLTIDEQMLNMSSILEEHAGQITAEFNNSLQSNDNLPLELSIEEIVQQAEDNGISQQVYAPQVQQLLEDQGMSNNLANAIVSNATSSSKRVSRSISKALPIRGKSIQKIPMEKERKDKKKKTNLEKLQSMTQEQKDAFNREYAKSQKERGRK